MKNQYKTKDLAEASALIVKGQILTALIRQDRICIFVFEDEQACKRISNQFFFGELLVNARTYHEAMGRLKNRIFAGV